MHNPSGVFPVNGTLNQPTLLAVTWIGYAPDPPPTTDHTTAMSTGSLFPKLVPVIERTKLLDDRDYGCSESDDHGESGTVTTIEFDGADLPTLLKAVT